VIGGRISNVDPVLWRLRGSGGVGLVIFSPSGEVQLQSHSRYSNEYGNLSGLPLSPMRNTKLRSYGWRHQRGCGLVRKVRTSVGWIFDQNDVLWSAGNSEQLREGSRSAGRRDQRTTGAATQRNLRFSRPPHAVMYGMPWAFRWSWGSRWAARTS